MGTECELRRSGEQEFEAIQANGFDFFGNIEKVHIYCGKHR